VLIAIDWVGAIMLLSDFYKINKDDQIWWVNDRNSAGSLLFSFDRKRIFSLFRDYPCKLTEQEKELFDRENPYWKEFFKNRESL
jgi:hypothetical protein